MFFNVFYSHIDVFYNYGPNSVICSRLLTVGASVFFVLDSYLGKPLNPEDH